MKRILLSLLAAVASTGPFVSPVLAQASNQEAVIPFSFVASNRTMPAGKYQISRVSPIAPVFALRDAKGSNIMIHFSSNEEGKPQNPSLTFACYGKECVLTRIASPGSQVAYSIPQSVIEKEMPHKLGIASMIAVKLGAR